MCESIYKAGTLLVIQPYTWSDRTAFAIVVKTEQFRIKTEPFRTFEEDVYIFFKARTVKYIFFKARTVKYNSLLLAQFAKVVVE